MALFNFVYKTTITVIVPRNNTFKQFYYVGKHSTDNLNDGYNGSGVLVQEIETHLKANKATPVHIGTTIIEVCTEDNLLQREEMRVRECIEAHGSDCINVQYRHDTDPPLVSPMDVLNRCMNYGEPDIPHKGALISEAKINKGCRLHVNGASYSLIASSGCILRSGGLRVAPVSSLVHWYKNTEYCAIVRRLASSIVGVPFVHVGIGHDYFVIRYNDTTGATVSLIAWSMVSRGRTDWKYTTWLDDKEYPNSASFQSARKNYKPKKPLFWLNKSNHESDWVNWKCAPCDDWTNMIPVIVDDLTAEIARSKTEDGMKSLLDDFDSFLIEFDEPSDKPIQRPKAIIDNSQRKWGDLLNKMKSR